MKTLTLVSVAAGFGILIGVTMAIEAWALAFIFLTFAGYLSVMVKFGDWP